MITYSPGVAAASLVPSGAATPAVALGIKRATVTFDRTWSPYIQGTVAAQLLSPADLANSDPRTGRLCKFTLQQTFNGVLQELPLALWLRSRSNDFVVGAETTMNVASVESMLQDTVDYAGGSYSGSGTQTDVSLIRDMSQYYLQQIPGLNTTIQTVDGSASFNVANADAGWDAGQSVWDLVNALEAQKSLWIRGDETGLVVQRMAAGYSADTSTHVITENDRVLTVTDTVDRDNPDYANAVFINYWYNNNANVATDYGVLGSGPFKSVVINRQGRRRSTGEATAQATRMSKRGRVLNVTAIADLTCRPNQTYRVDYLGYSWTTTVQAVTFRHPDGLMDLTLNVNE